MRKIGWLSAIALVAAVYAYALVVDHRVGRSHPAAGAVIARFEPVELGPGLTIQRVRAFPEALGTLLVGPASSPDIRGLVYAGTAGTGSIVRFNPSGAGDTFVIAAGTGDAHRFGTCHVNRLGLHDLNGDGALELLGTTSQVQPTGRPKLGVWSSQRNAPALIALARPDIKSSWTHALGALQRPGDASPSLFITFCGYGEIVEYRMEHGLGANGFTNDVLTWKVVGNLPASGEWLQVIDADNDGREDVCVATGFAFGKAAIHLYQSDGPGLPLRLTRAIEEDGRFGNVRFIAADMKGDGQTEIFAWWCADLAGGNAEMIAYRLGPEGVTDRKVLAKAPAGALWADDNASAVADLDADGRQEVWFGTAGGGLWRYDPTRSSTPVRMARFKRTPAPMAFGEDYLSRKPRLYVGQGKELLAIEAEPPAQPIAASMVGQASH